MNTNQIYIGTIKKCKSVYLYEKHGEKRYIGDFKINGMESGYIDSIVDTVTEKAILIKISKNRYVWLNQVESLKDKILLEIGLPNKIINSLPIKDNDLFVDESTLIPYFQNETDKNISIGKLKKKVLTDPRLKLGIEN